MSLERRHGRTVPGLGLGLREKAGTPAKGSGAPPGCLEGLRMLPGAAHPPMHSARWVQGPCHLPKHKQADVTLRPAARPQSPPSFATVGVSAGNSGNGASCSRLAPVAQTPTGVTRPPERSIHSNDPGLLYRFKIHTNVLPFSGN